MQGERRPCKSGVAGQRRWIEGSRATDQIDVRSGRRGLPASDRLAGMTKSPAAAALDSIVADVLAPDLKSMGFRKKSRHWSHEAGETYRGVTVQSSQFNVTSDSRFTVEIGASFVALGHPVPNAPGAWGTAVSRRLSGLRSEPIDEWFAYDALDEATIERAGLDLGRTWAQLGRPFLAALQSPQALCDFVCDTGSAELALEVLDRVGVPLGDEARQSQLARIAADRAAARERWRHLPNDPHPLELGIGIWAEVVRQFHRLGLQLGDEHRRSATAVLADAKSGILTTRFHSERDEIDAQELEAALRD